MQPTDDVHFRKALAYCVDYEVIREKLWPGSQALSGPIPDSMLGKNSEIKAFNQDFEKAKEELALSKYANNPDAWKMKIYYTSETAAQERVALMLQSNWAQLGIKTEVLAQPFATVQADAMSLGTTPNGAMILLQGSYLESGSVLQTRYHSNSAGSWESMEWLEDPKFDAMIEDALATTDDTERFAK